MLLALGVFNLEISVVEMGSRYEGIPLNAEKEKSVMGDKEVCHLGAYPRCMKIKILTSPQNHTFYSH